MAKTTKIGKVTKTVQWAKSVLGLTDKDIAEYKKAGYPILYAYSYLPYGAGAEDSVNVKCFNKPLPEEVLPKFFSNSKIKGYLFGDLCEINLLEAE